MKQSLMFFCLIFLISCVSGGTVSSKYNPVVNSVTVGNTVIHINNDLKYIPSDKGAYNAGNIDDEYGSDIERTYHIFVEKNKKINSGVCVLVQRLTDPHHYLRTSYNFIAERKYIPKDIFKRIRIHGLKFVNKGCMHVVYLRKQLGSSRWVDVIYAEGGENCTFYHGEAPNGYKEDVIDDVWNNFNKAAKISHQ
jgi:hypothetical protein